MALSGTRFHIIAVASRIGAIHRRIVLSVVNIPEEQPPRPETPNKIHTEDGDVVDVPMDIPADD
jgi:hypothetical protein